MEYFEIINKIKIILLNNYPELSEEVNDAQLSGGTFAERLTLVYVKLLEIKKSNKEAFKLIKDEASLLFEYAHGIGYYPRLP